VPGVVESQRERLAELITQRGQGNPFITSHILRDLGQLTAKPTRSNGQHVTGSWLQQAAQIPFAVREVVLLKLARLTPAARELLSEAAAVDEQFDLHALSGNRPGEPVAGLLGECLENGLITAIQPGVYKFTHPMMREIAAEWLTPWRRQRVGSRSLRDGAQHLRHGLQPARNGLSPESEAEVAVHPDPYALVLSAGAYATNAA
jgi:predicted ATPase